MHWKKYWALLLPFFLGLLLAIIFLPEDKKLLSLLVPVLFWVIYYSWVYLDNRKKNQSGKVK